MSQQLKIMSSDEAYESRSSKSMSIRDFGFMLTVIVNIVIAVWIASRVTTTVDNLVSSVKSLEFNVIRIRDNISEIETEYNGRLSKVEQELELNRKNYVK